MNTLEEVKAALSKIDDHNAIGAHKDRYLAAEDKVADAEKEIKRWNDILARRRTYAKAVQSQYLCVRRAFSEITISEIIRDWENKESPLIHIMMLENDILCHDLAIVQRVDHDNIWAVDIYYAGLEGRQLDSNTWPYRRNNGINSVQRYIHPTSRFYLR